MTTEEILQKLAIVKGPAWSELLIEMEMQCAKIESQRPGSIKFSTAPSKVSFALRSGLVGLEVTYKGDRVEWNRFKQSGVLQMPARAKGSLSVFEVGGQTFFALPGHEAFPDFEQTALYLIDLLF
jgi:hypothetical protein